MEQKLTDLIIEQLSTLRRAPTKYGIAPHKPVLLLSLIDFIETGSIKDNKFPVGTTLFSFFNRNWGLLINQDFSKDITLPLHHLSDGLGWDMVDRNGRPVMKKLSSQKRVSEEVEYGKFSDQFWQFLQSQENRELARWVLLSIYFPSTKESYLKETKMPVYFREIELSIVEEGRASYRQITSTREGYIRNFTFRSKVLEIYQNTCAISRLRITPPAGIIQACHIEPFAKSGLNSIKNGVALCANLHAAFDVGFLSIDKDYKVTLSRRNTFQENNYSSYSLKVLNGSSIFLPDKEQFWPSQEYLGQHRKRWGFKQ